MGGEPSVLLRGRGRRPRHVIVLRQLHRVAIPGPAAEQEPGEFVTLPVGGPVERCELVNVEDVDVAPVADQKANDVEFVAGDGLM